jgi:ABC-2 type transport system permease protein
VYGSPVLIDESTVSVSSLGNLDLFLNTVNYVTDKKDTLSVRTVSTEQQYLNVTASKATLWSILIVGVLPILVLCSGGYVVLRRRKK